MPQTLEKKIAQWKLQVGEYKHQVLVLRETSEQKKSALRKAIRSQKKRAERFEAAVENLISGIRERVSDYAVSNAMLCCFKLSNWDTFTCGT